MKSGKINALGNLDASANTAAISLPRGTTLQRPAGVPGMMRFNVDLGYIETFNDGVWLPIPITGASLVTYNNAGLIVLANLPTSDPKVKGALWNNSNVLNVSAG